MSDLLRICLFIFLSLGIVASPIVYSIEIFLEYFHFDRFLFAIGLSLTQLILLVVVLKTKHFRTIVFVLIFVTIVSLILFFIELRYFQNYLRIHREDFYRLIFNYPKGNKPNEKRLIDHFLVVQEKKCCGVTRNYLLAFEEQEYFHYFPDNCVSLYDPRPRQTFRYKHEFCMKFFIDVQKSIRILGLVKIFLYTTILIFIWIDVFIAEHRRS